MFFSVDSSTRPPTITLVEPEVFSAFSIVVASPSDPFVEAVALHWLGEVADDEHVYIEEARVLSLAGDRAGDEAWRGQLDAMISHARSRGWTDDDSRIRAHVERAV